MRQCRVSLRVLATLMLVVGALAGCDNGNSDPFAECGNGILDANEQCDDGNLLDNDDCLSTCTIAICGDTFVNQREEDCDRENLGGQSCSTVGFQSGALSCDQLCRFDTSGCVAPPTATRTATAPATSTPTSEATVPSGTPTAIVGCEAATVGVALAFDAGLTIAGIDLELAYDPDLTTIPGSGTDASVGERVTDLSGTGGLLSAFDADTDADGADDQLRVGYITTGVSLSPTEFVAIRFGCAGAGANPMLADFTCVIRNATDEFGNDLTSEVGCGLTVKTTAAATPTATQTSVPQTPVATASPTVTATPAASATVFVPSETPTGVVTPSTPSPTEEPTATGPPTPTATPTVPSALCGNGSVEPPETCDDGNTNDGDACPSDCRIVLCATDGTQQQVAVSFSAPGGASVSSLAVLLVYPDGVVQVPGTGSASSVSSRVTNRPPGALVSAIDLDYVLRVAIAGTRALAPEVFRVNFDHCQDAPPATSAHFTCTVLEAVDTANQPVANVTCAAAAP